MTLEESKTQNLFNEVIRVRIREGPHNNVTSVGKFHNKGDKMKTNNYEDTNLFCNCK